MSEEVKPLQSYNPMLANGSAAYTWSYERADVKKLTVGQVRIKHTQSQGTDEYSQTQTLSYSGTDRTPDNMSPKEEYEEEYMCVETGIGSGSVYTYGKTIFATEEECRRVMKPEYDRRQQELRAKKIAERESRVYERDQQIERLARMQEAVKRDEAEAEKERRAEQRQSYLDAGLMDIDAEWPAKVVLLTMPEGYEAVLSVGTTYTVSETRQHVWRGKAEEPEVKLTQHSNSWLPCKHFGPGPKEEEEQA